MQKRIKTERFVITSNAHFDGEGMNNLIQRAREVKLIEWLPANKRAWITNLQYADNTILFGRIMSKRR